MPRCLSCGRRVAGPHPPCPGLPPGPPDFHESEVDTLASMISLAGRRYEGDVALSDDPAYLNRVGLIELYETLLRRALGLSIDGTPRVNQSDLNKAVLLAANRLAGLYLLLGNEAFADAADPTIGFSTGDGQYGTEAPSIFSFQNQVDSLLGRSSRCCVGGPTQAPSPSTTMAGLELHDRRRRGRLQGKLQRRRPEP